MKSIFLILVIFFISCSKQSEIKETTCKHLYWEVITKDEWIVQDFGLICGDFTGYDTIFHFICDTTTKGRWFFK